MVASGILYVVVVVMVYGSTWHVVYDAGAMCGM